MRNSYCKYENGEQAAAWGLLVQGPAYTLSTGWLLERLLYLLLRKTEPLRGLLCFYKLFKGTFLLSFLKIKCLFQLSHHCLANSFL